MRAPDGLAAVLYGPCEVRTTVGGRRRSGSPRRRPIPFRSSCGIRVDPESPVDFILHLRIPTWADEHLGGLRGRRDPPRGRLAPRRQDVAGGRRHRPLVRRAGPAGPRQQRRILRAARPALLRACRSPPIKRPVKDYPLPGFHDYFCFPAVWAQGHYALPKPSPEKAAPDFALVAELCGRREVSLGRRAAPPAGQRAQPGHGQDGDRRASFPWAAARRSCAG